MVQKTSLDSISAQIKEGDINNLNIIIKAQCYLYRSLLRVARYLRAYIKTVLFYLL